MFLTTFPTVHLQELKEDVHSVCTLSTLESLHIPENHVAEWHSEPHLSVRSLSPDMVALGPPFPDKPPVLAELLEAQREQIVQLKQLLAQVRARARAPSRCRQFLFEPWRQSRLT